ncbi:hypothetical protein KM915_21055 [Cytobacillus oceanisediminis]|uniref:hypothetical protein n=1 Tax=Cytobacillus oceanisediminis TaxID=665099 RepID=UPI001C22F5B8|nr:hypothetical protein [Cytobacillus oceanisediminis]MBU8732541.1 hypothetical protein [Cytobacillus oceanisediminis]
MKKSLEKIYSRFPSVELKMKGEEIPLTNVEDVFYQLALFVSNPDMFSFNINLFYKYLQNEELILGMEIILDFFQKDTFLIQNKKESFIKAGSSDNEKLYNQTSFANYLSERGLNYNPIKLGTYYRREKEKRTGKIPLEDLLIDGKPYWYESTVDLFARELLKDEKNKSKKK